MLLQNRHQKAVAVLFGCAIVIATIALFPSTQLSVNDSCQISGPIQKLKLFVQGKYYWAKQFQFLDQEVQYLETQPDRIRNTQQMVGEMTKEVLERHRQFMEEQYSKHPEFRPSRGQVVAGELRKQADAIEHAELLEKLEQLYAQTVTTLKSCRSIILEAAQ